MNQEWEKLQSAGHLLIQIQELGSLMIIQFNSYLSDFLFFFAFAKAYDSNEENNFSLDS